jgi:formate hydrogenlyase transcriptional activator
MKELAMSAVEFALPPQTSPGGSSLVPFERPLAEALASRYERLSSRTQSEADRNGARMKLLAELSGGFAGDMTLETFLTEMTAKIRRIVVSDVALLGLSNRDDERFQVIAFDANDDMPLGREAIQVLGEAFWEHVLCSGEQWTGKLEDVKQSHTAECKWMGAHSTHNCILPLVAKDRILGVLALGKDSAYAKDELEYLGLVSNQVAVVVENFQLHAELKKLKDEFGEEKVHIGDELPSEACFEEIVGRSAALQRVLRQVEVVAPTDSGVLIQGETGTGKELIARAIHNRSGRRDRPFIKVNCAAIPSGLLESELFGHEKGAFTGAIMRKPGRFELADKGTLFLDEVGDIPLELQSKLLRVLQEKEFERLGSTRTQQVDVRVIAATHRDLKQMIKEGTFRSDLYYRLHVFPLTVPSLRERREDIPLIVRHYVNKFAQRMNRNIDTIPSKTMEVLAGYPWPGNVRELQNFIERAVILSPGSSLRPPLEELTEKTQEDSRSNLSSLEEMEREHVLRALRESNWVTGGPNGAAIRLGMKRTTLAYRIRKLGIPCRPE